MLNQFKNRIILFVFILLISISQTGCVFFGIRSLEEPKYNVLEKDGDFELREYESFLVAQTVVKDDFDKAGNVSFKRLFGYISGENIKKEKMSMTIPVVAQSETNEEIKMTIPVLAEDKAEGWLFSFVLPSKYDLESIPLPLNDKVFIAEIKERKVAVLRFSGFWSDKYLEEKNEMLINWAIDNKLEIISSPSFATYDPPFAIPFLRRNEVMIEIVEK